MKRADQRGLTIIEMMVIVAVLGIVLSVSIPAYQDHAVREKVREAVTLAGPARTALGVACREGRLPGMDNESLGLAPASARAGDYARSIVAAGVSATEGIVTVVLNAIDDVIDEGRTVVLTGVCEAGDMRWTVAGDVAPKYLPEGV